jgi:hypothetical protein
MIQRICHPDNAATARSLRHNTDAMFYGRLKWRLRQSAPVGDGNDGRDL